MKPCFHANTMDGAPAPPHSDAPPRLSERRAARGGVRYYRFTVQCEAAVGYGCLGMIATQSVQSVPRIHGGCKVGYPGG
jgi:hypothetical protein